jgi:pimeloyl-ACP methyl ester carboxylesterase
MDRTTYEPDVVPWLVERGYRVVNVDLRGHGGTGWADSYRAVDFAGDVAELIRELDSGPVVVVGHSLGGLVAATLASEDPELVKALFLEDPPLFGGDEEVRNSIEFYKRNAEFGGVIRGWQVKGMKPDDLAEELATWPFRYPGETMLGFHGAVGLRDWAEAFLAFDPDVFEGLIGGELWDGFDPTAAIECPMTVLAAEPDFDSVFLPEHADMLKSAVPQARVVQVPGAAHEIHVRSSGLNTYLDELERLLDSLS